MKTYDFDVIVVGSGMSGGYAAKEFCEKGYKTLVLDRGKELQHGDYKTESVPPWKLENRGRLSEEDLSENFDVNRKCYALNEYTRDYFINDKENPFIQEKPFNWFRSNKIGGKSLLWARQSYRWNKLDFEANAKDGHGIDWPIRYEDLEPWYDYVEPFIGISGSKENLDELPDGKFLPALPLNVAEKEVKTKIEKLFPGRKVIPARTANLTEPQPIHTKLGRGLCQARNECDRGCSWGGYYSSLSGALAAAKLTNNMTLTANAQVQKVIYDEKTGKATGVQYIDTQTKTVKKVTAKVIFMCASALASVQILLNSTSKKYPNGIGNSSGVLGHYIMDHLGGVGAVGRVPGHLESYYKGRRPAGIYIPRFKNLKSENNGYIRGFGYQGGANRESWHNSIHKDGIGVEFKESIRQPGDWYFGLTAFGEMIPQFDNRVYLHPTKKDQWGIPLLVINVDHDKNSINMREDMKNSAEDMLKTIGLKDIKASLNPSTPGSAIHEMGGACMGKDPKTSYLNKWSQNHEVKNLFVTDGSAFPSQSCVNPSITFMALTARAADYADKQLKGGLL